MIDFNEIRQTMCGSWELARGRPEGLQYFDPSLEAFWRSFQVIIYVLPVYLLLISIPATADLGFSGTLSFISSHKLYFLGQALFMIIEWLTFPILMISLTRILGVTERYGLFVTVSNWSSLMIVALLLPFNLFWNFGVGGDFPAFVFSLLIMIMLMRYRWFIAVTVLKVPSFTAVGLVVIEVLISFIFAGITSKIFGPLA